MTAPNAKRLTVAEALKIIVDDVDATPIEQRNLDECPGMTLGQDISARLTQPPEHLSAMDGYAIAHADQHHDTLNIIGESSAGHPFISAIEPGECVRIFTGAVLPKGTDSILIQEDARRDGDTLTATEWPPKGAYTRRKGIDFTQGDVCLHTGTCLAPRHLGLAAAMGHAVLPVHRKPRVAILATGDELVPPGALPGPGQIISSNPHALEALMRQFGAEVDMLGIATDTMDDLATHLARTDDADVLITIGGASVGDHDLVHAALQEFGVGIDFWKINMRPGKPLMYGRKPGLHVIGVPGNPVSSLICARIFAVPLVRALAGRAITEPHPRQLPLLAPIEANGPRQHYMRATATSSGVTAAKSQDSSLQSVLAESNALIVRAPDEPAASTGDLVDVIDIDF